MKLIELARLTEAQARKYLERILWPNGPACPHCGNADKSYALEGESNRDGLYKCASCREPFTVTVGTVMESSHVPLTRWLVAFYLMTSSKKGFSAHQLHRTIGVSYKTAWFMAHRIRHALAGNGNGLLGGPGGIIEADETYVGGKPRKGTGIHKRGRGTSKTPVMVLVERNGKAKVTPLTRVDGENLKREIRENVDPSATLMTDENSAYKGIGDEFAGGHQTVNHGAGEYARDNVNTNTAESFFSLVKRQHYGTNHQYSKRHMHRYLAETAFRWDYRKVDDATRTDAAIGMVKGKRLTYRRAG